MIVLANPPPYLWLVFHPQLIHWQGLVSPKADVGESEVGSLIRIATPVLTCVHSYILVFGLNH
jgi:hypothetical protein